MALACAGGRMGGCETTPPTSRTPTGDNPGTPAPASTTGRLSSHAIIGRRLPASSSFVLARALTGRYRCGRSSVTPAGAAARNPAAAKKTSTIQPDDHTEVTGTGQHTLLTAKAPMGGPHGWVGG